MEQLKQPVRSMKTLIAKVTGNGYIDNVAFSQSLLELRSTPRGDGSQQQIGWTRERTEARGGSAGEDNRTAKTTTTIITMTTENASERTEMAPE